MKVAAMVADGEMIKSCRYRGTSQKSTEKKVASTGQRPSYL